MPTNRQLIAALNQRVAVLEQQVEDLGDDAALVAEIEVIKAWIAAHDEDLGLGVATNVTAVPGDGQATITWNYPSPAPDDYTILVTPSAGAPMTVDTSPQVVTGLTNGVSYIFQIQSNFSTPTSGSTLSAASAPVICRPPAPTINSLSVSTGTGAGGTSVVITGTRLTGATSVTFVGTEATSFTVDSATQITATTPAHAAGSGSVRVTTPGGVSPDTVADDWVFTAVGAAPTVTSVTPALGSALGGLTITIVGTNFTGTTAVDFGATPAADFTVVNPTTITALTPAHAAGSVNVRVTNAVGQSPVSSAYAFIDVPTITSISPDNGSTAGGTSVVITGTGFTAVTAVRFGGVHAASYTVDSLTQITAVTPSGQAGTFQTRVNTLGGGTADTAADDWTYNAAGGIPTVTNVTPNTGSTSGGTTVVITGTNFTSVTAITFQGNGVNTPAASFTIDSSTQITAVTPVGAEGVYNIRCTNPSGISADGVADNFTFELSVGPPEIYGLSPTTGLTSGGQSVIISGANFVDVTEVYFGFAAATSYTVVSDTQIIAVTPVALPGTLDVFVQTASGLSSATGTANDFLYQAPTAAPAITAMSPRTGPTAGGTSVVITGTNFTGANVVQFEGINARSFTVNSPTSITAVAPTGAVGVADVTITSPTGGTSTAAIAPPTLVGTSTVGWSSTVTPQATSTIACLAGDMLVCMIADEDSRGYPHVPTTAGVTWTKRQEPVVDNSAQAYVSIWTAPITSNGNYSVSVTRDAATTFVRFGAILQAWRGVGAVGASASRFVTSTSAPTVELTTTAANSAVVCIASDYTATATTGYGRDTSDATPAADIIACTQVAGAYTISADYYSNSGAVGTKTIGFTGPSSQKFSIAALELTGILANEYTYTASAAIPTVTALSPTSGSTAGNESVVITGTNFTGTTLVKFGNINAVSFTVNSSTQITAISPVGTAGVTSVRVTNGNGVSTDTSSDDWTYVAAGVPTVTGISPSTGYTTGGTSVVLTGTNFTYRGSVGSTPRDTAVVTALSAGTVDAANPVPGSHVYHNPAGSPWPWGNAAVYTGNGKTFDWRGVSIETAAPTPTAMPEADAAYRFGARIRQGSPRDDLTFLGGYIYTDPAVLDVENTYWEQTWHRCLGINSEVPGTTVVGTQFYNLGDGCTFNFGADNWSVIGCAFDNPNSAGANSRQAYIHDDSVENDTHYNGTIDDCLFNGVHVFLSCAASSVHDGQANTVSVSNSLVRMRGYYNSYHVPPLGTEAHNMHGPIFKWATNTVTQGYPPSLQIENCVFYAEDIGGWSFPNIDLPTPLGSATVSTNNCTLIWGGAGSWPADQRVNWDAFSTNLTVINAGISEWNTRAAAWRTAHPSLNDMAVTFGNTQAAEFLRTNSTHITAVSPPLAAGTSSIRVLTPGGQSANTSSDDFVVTTAPVPPTVTSISPTTGPASGGTSVVITGTGFSGVTSVKFGALNAASYVVNSTTQITAVSPVASVSTVDVTVTNAAGGSPAVAGDRFTFSPVSLLPTVTAVSPTSGLTTGGTTVVITGTNFSGVTAVKFGALNAASYTVNSTTQITAVTPVGTAGVVNVNVTTAEGVSADVVGDNYTFVTPVAPAVTSIAPTSGTTSGGTVVTISGTNFGGVTAVRFSGIAATSFTYVNSTTITAVAPPHAAGVTDVVVTTSAGSSVNTSNDNYTFTSVVTTWPTASTTGVPYGFQAPNLGTTGGYLGLVSPPAYSATRSDIDGLGGGAFGSSSVPVEPTATTISAARSDLLLNRRTTNLTITTNGTVLNGVFFDGCGLIINANNVTVKNCLFRGGASTGKLASISIGVGFNDSAFTGNIVQDCEFDFGYADYDVYAIAHCGYTAIRCHFRRGHGLHHGGDVQIIDNYFEDLSSWGAGASHPGATAWGLVHACVSNGMVVTSQATGQTATTLIRHNSFNNQLGQTAVIAAYGDTAPIHHYTVDNNYFRAPELAPYGGAYGGYWGYNASKPFGTQDTNITIANNVFWNGYKAATGAGGTRGSGIGFRDAQPGNSQGNNKYEDGTTVTDGGFNAVGQSPVLAEPLRYQPYIILAPKNIAGAAQWDIATGIARTAVDLGITPPTLATLRSGWTHASVLNNVVNADLYITDTGVHQGSSSGTLLTTNVTITSNKITLANTQVNGSISVTTSVSKEVLLHTCYVKTLNTTKGGSNGLQGQGMISCGATFTSGSTTWIPSRMSLVNCTVDAFYNGVGPPLDGGTVTGGSMQIFNCNITGGAKVVWTEDNSYIGYSYLHHPANGIAGMHYSAVYGLGKSNLWVEGCYLDLSMTVDPIWSNQDYSPTEHEGVTGAMFYGGYGHDVDVDNCFLAGGNGTCVNGFAGTSGQVFFRNNKLAPPPYSASFQAHANDATSVCQWTGNTNSETGAAINI